MEVYAAGNRCARCTGDEWAALPARAWRRRRLLELENLEEVVGAGVDDDEVLMTVDRDALGRVDVGADAAVEGAVDGPRGVQVAGAVQQQAAVALVADDEVRRTVEAHAARLVELVVAATSTMPGDSALTHRVRLHRLHFVVTDRLYHVCDTAASRHISTVKARRVLEFLRHDTKYLACVEKLMARLIYRTTKNKKKN